MFFGEKEIKFLNNYLKINKLDYLFIDVGANYGIYTFLFGPQSIFSFIIEPIYECIEYIKSGYSNQNIKFINKVASDDNAIKSLSIPLEGNKKIFGRSSLSKSFDNFIKLDIDSIRLDELIEEVIKHNFEILFIKIDVEGHENNVIDGSIKLIEDRKSLLLIEIEKRHNSKYELIYNKLKNLGFISFYIEKNKLIKINNLKELEDSMEKTINFVFKNF
tara:strand:- start:679 stop:1332 length:654 start_codon:yes stop_codon:yes gene_type:complete